MKTLQEFYDFYSAIPDERWCTGNFVTDNGACCAAGHLGMRQGLLCDNLTTLCNLLDMPSGDIYRINDAQSYSFPQSTPKARILALIKSKMN